MPKTAGISLVRRAGSDAAQFVSVALFSRHRSPDLADRRAPAHATACSDLRSAAVAQTATAAASSLSAQAACRSACRLQRAGNGFLAVLRADLDAVGGNEFGFVTPMKPNTQRR